MKHLAACACVLFLSLVFSADASCRRGCVAEQLDFTIGAGHRIDSMSVSDDDEGILLSDKNTKDFDTIRMVPFFIKGEYVHPCNFYAAVYVAYAKAYDGNYSDQRFIQVGNDFTLSEHTIGCAKQQEAFDAYGELGWRFTFCRDFFTFIPVIGYANYQQNIWAKDLELQIGPLRFDPCTASSNLKSYWRGRYIGFNLKSGPYWSNWKLDLGYDYSFTYYSDTVNTLLFEGAFGSTELDIDRVTKHSSHGQGHHFWFGIDYYCQPQWSIGIFGDARWFSTGSGCMSYEQQITQTIRECGRGNFEGATWKSWAIYLTLGYHWP